MKEPNRVPFTRKREIRLAVAVKINEYRPTDQTEFREGLGDGKCLAVVAEQIRGGRFGITACHHATANE